MRVKPATKRLIQAAVFLCLMPDATAFAADDSRWLTYKRSGEAAFKRGDLPAAEAMFSNALKEAQAFPKEDMRLLKSIAQLAVVYSHMGKLSQAEDLYRQELVITDRPPHGPILADNLYRLAQSIEDQGKIAEAQPYYLRALTVRRSCFGPTHPDVLLAAVNLAINYIHQRKYAQAGLLIKEMQGVGNKYRHQPQRSFANALVQLADAYTYTGAFDRAEPLYKQSVAIFDSSSSYLRVPYLAHAYLRYANACQYAKKTGQAETLVSKALALLQNWRTPWESYLLRDLVALALTLLQAGKVQQADFLYGLAFSKANEGGDLADSLQPMLEFAKRCLDGGKVSEAERLYTLAAAIATRRGESFYKFLGLAYLGLARTDLARGRVRSASQHCKQALAIVRKTNDPELLKQCRVCERR